MPFLTGITFNKIGFERTRRRAASPGIFVEYAVIAGGGGGGITGSGGGAAGGFRQGLFEYTTGVTYPISIGGGGSFSTNPSGNLYSQGLKGSPSSFATIISTGGGGGGAYFEDSNNPQAINMPGGSGAGAGNGGGGTGNTPPYSPPQGNPGGFGPAWGHGGGGGAGAAGQSYTGPSGPDMPSFTSGIGGIGGAVTWPEVPSSYGTVGPSPGRWFAAGGSGGAGIGGRVSPAPGQPVGGGGATNASASSNTGSGGGGGATSGTNGGSGIVILRMPISVSYSTPGGATFTSPTHRVLVYTGSSTITFNS